MGHAYKKFWIVVERLASCRMVLVTGTLIGVHVDCFC